MLDLVRCEFTKLKRRKITLMLIVLSCFFPLIVVITTKNGMSGDLSTHYLKMRFDLSFTMTQGYGLVFLAPCLIGMLATILFFMERDNDTFKNIRTVPVTITKMILAKICVLFIYGTINEQISNFAQSYPANSITASIEAPLLINRYRFVSCSCFSCFCKKA